MTSSNMNQSQLPQRMLLGAGPSTVHPRVLQAMTMPVVGHLDPAFFQVMDDVCDMLREVFHTENKMTVPISSTGTGAMETACANVIEPGDEVLMHAMAPNVAGVIGSAICAGILWSVMVG